MIVIGYQGIGKSTLSSASAKFVDLEKGNFYFDGERDEKWYRYYINIAQSLSDQGYAVLVSSHDSIRKELASRDLKGNVTLCCPSPSLERQWVDKLVERYNREPSKENFEAYVNAQMYYSENIHTLLQEAERCGWNTTIIESDEYTLEDLLKPNL